VSDESRRGGNGFLDMLFFQQKMLHVLGKKVIGLVAWDKTFCESRRVSVQPQYSPYQQLTFCYLDNMN